MKNDILTFTFHCKIEKKLSSKISKAYETDLRQFENFIICKVSKDWKIRLK